MLQKNICVHFSRMTAMYSHEEIRYIFVYIYTYINTYTHRHIYANKLVPY